jgi:hypothetical protein
MDSSSPTGSDAVEPDIRIRQDYSALEITGRYLDRVILRLIKPEDLRAAVTQFVLDAEDRVKPVLGLPVDPVEAQSFLRFAKRAAYHCLVACTADDYTKVSRLRDAIARRIAVARSLDGAMTVEVVNESEDYLPWEWLGAKDAQPDLESEADSVLGFATVVHRRGVHDETSASYGGFLVADPLQLRFLRHPDLDGTKSEYAFFRYSKAFRLVGPLPADDGPLRLAQQLRNPCDSEEGPDQVVHLSCHHDALKDPRKMTAYELAMLQSTLAFGAAADQVISVDDLRNGLADSEEPPPGIELPLVFFNGCRGNFHPFAAESVVRVLARNGNRAVVSTSMKVPDDVAAEFGGFYYRRLLAGDTSAAALRHARWDLLVGRGSPLGLLYTYYGAPTLRVAPVPSVAQSWSFPAEIGGRSR